MQKHVQVDHFISNAPAEFRIILDHLRQLIFKAVPDINEDFKWNMPVYRQKSLCCYISVHKDHINLGFHKGIYLSDPLHLLEGTGKELRHYKIRTMADIKPQIITGWIRHACAFAS